jgi:DNA-binding transcriptional LysR family regulator/HKD family nuclease
VKFVSHGIGELVLEELGRASESSLAVAFFNPNAGMLAALAGLPKLKLIISKEFVVNNPYKLEKLKLNLLRSIPPDDRDGKFHAKVLIIKRRNGSYWILLGSANLTHPGMSSNREACVVMESDNPADEQSVRAIRVWFDSLFQRARRPDLDQAKLIFDAQSHYRRELRPGRTAKQDAEVVLNVGRSPYTDPFLITTLLSVKVPLFPQLKIELSQQFSYDLVHEVLAGGVDLAIATEPPESKRLTTVKFTEAPFYIAMPEDDELAYEDSVCLDVLTGRPWVIFERRMHPPVYDAVMRLAEERKVAPAKLHHIVVPEDAYSFIADDRAVAFVVKAGAIRIAREGITVRPLAEEALMLKTYLASRADEKSKVVSELVRAFMRKLSTFTQVTPFPVRNSA